MEPQGVTKSGRTRRIPTRVREFEMFPDNTLTNEGDFVHLALFVDAEPIEFKQVVNERTWFKAMKQEIRAIEKIKT